jgi:hypothetical protein
MKTWQQTVKLHSAGGISLKAYCARLWRTGNGWGSLRMCLTQCDIMVFNNGGDNGNTR